MFETILVANRGEIAARIIAVLKSRGIRSVAIYSEADRTAPHTLAADVAVCVGPPAVRESYLNQDAILSIAKEHGVQAIPGSRESRRRRWWHRHGFG
jgi:acetyl/propionyl-CoA carboxylase alpha subunit